MSTKPALFSCFTKNDRVYVVRGTWIKGSVAMDIYRDGKRTAAWKWLNVETVDAMTPAGPASLIDVVSAVVIDPQDTTLLLTQRGPQSDYPGLWESPGGKVEPTDASPVEALRREVGEELGVECDVGKPLGTTIVARGPGKPLARVTFYNTTLHGEPRAVVADRLMWADIDSVRKMAKYKTLMPANVQLMDEVINAMLRAGERER